MTPAQLTGEQLAGEQLAAWRDPLPSTPLPPEPLRCHADSDGDCSWCDCPQNKDSEPERSGRSCPLVDMRAFEW